jgi:hypothetical protein
MTTPRPGAAQKLVELLETLPTDDRREITAWLLGLARGPAALSLGPPLTVTWTGESTALPVRAPSPSPVPRLAPLGSALSAGEESQLVTIRLPAERHTQLRTWCAEHGFTMASVVRGLVERFLEQQSPG